MGKTVDLTGLYDLFRGDRARMREWLQLYLEEAPRLFDQLSDAHEQGDVDALVHAAHELRPQAHYLGSLRMLVLLKEIGDRAKVIGVIACEEHIKELRALSGRIDTEISEFLAGRPS